MYIIRLTSGFVYLAMRVANRMWYREILDSRTTRSRRVPVSSKRERENYPIVIAIVILKAYFGICQMLFLAVPNKHSSPTDRVAFVAAAKKNCRSTPEQTVTIDIGINQSKYQV